MWVCSQCDEEQEDQFEACWNCQAERGTAASQRPSQAEESPAGAVSSRRKGRASATRDSSAAVISRYGDAYLVARATAVVGAVNSSPFLTDSQRAEAMSL